MDRRGSFILKLLIGRFNTRAGNILVLFCPPPTFFFFFTLKAISIFDVRWVRVSEECAENLTNIFAFAKAASDFLGCALILSVSKAKKSTANARFGFPQIFTQDDLRVERKKNVEENNMVSYTYTFTLIS